MRQMDDDDEYEAGDILKAMVIVATVYLLLGLMVDDCGSPLDPQSSAMVAGQAG